MGFEPSFEVCEMKAMAVRRSILCLLLGLVSSISNGQTIRSVQPSTGALQGGTRLFIAGSGFGGKLGH